MKPALRIGIVVAALCVVAMLVWQGVTAHGAPDPTRPDTSPTVAFLDIGILVFRLKVYHIPMRLLPIDCFFLAADCSAQSGGANHLPLIPRQLTVNPCAGICFGPPFERRGEAARVDVGITRSRAPALSSVA